MDIDPDFSESANALLCLKMGWPNQPQSMDDQFESETTSTETSEETAHDTLNAIKASSWRSDETIDSFARMARKRIRKKVVTADCVERQNEVTQELLTVEVGGQKKAGTDKKASSRGRYKCSLCGAFKTNHVCALVPDKLMCSVGIQSTPGSAAISQNTSDALLRCASGMTDGSTSHDDSCDTLPARRLSAGMAPLLGFGSRSDSIDFSECSIAVSSAPVSTTKTTVTSPVPSIPPVASAPSMDGGAVFQERVIMVSRNRTSIHDTPAHATAPSSAGPPGAPSFSSSAGCLGDVDDRGQDGDGLHPKKTPKYTCGSTPRSSPVQLPPSALPDAALLAAASPSSPASASTNPSANLSASSAPPRLLNGLSCQSGSGIGGSMGMGSLSNLSALGRVENNNLNGGNGSFGNLSNLSSYGSYGVMGIGDLSLLSQPLSINTPSSGLTMGLYIPHASLVESNVICYPLRL